MDREHRTFVFRLSLAGAALACVLLFAGIALRALAQGNEPLRGQQVIPDKAKWAPNFLLKDQTGTLIGPQQLRGRVVVMTFLDSLCTQDCPVIGKELARVQQQLGPTVPWTLLIVSVAPTTDSPASSAAFAKKSGWTGDWHWLLGSPTQLAKVWKDYGIWVKPTPSDILHTAAVFVIGPDQYMRVVDTVPFVPDDLIQSIRALASRPRAGWLGWLPRI